MKAFNIRQLKNNPRTALAAARAGDMVVVMNRDRPQAVLVDLEHLGGADLPSVRVALAVSLFRQGGGSVGFAARMAGKSVSDMLTLLSQQGVSLVSVSQADEVLEEMEVAEAWLKPQSSS